MKDKLEERKFNIRVCILLVLSFLPLSMAIGQDYFRTREIFVLAGPRDVIDEGDVPWQR